MLLMLLLLVQQPAAIQQDSCVKCHSDLAGTPLGAPAELFPTDVHAEAGLSCASCHGGDASADDMEAAKDRQKGYTGAPDRSRVADSCGKCHSSAEYMRQYDPSLRIDQVSEYVTSVHGRKMAQGDLNVASCVSCHSVHEIRRSSNPQSSVHPLRVADTCSVCHSDADLMEPYQIAHDQDSEYRKSKHARALYENRDLSAPTCNDCHGNHGAVPPGTDSVANVCSRCHGIQRELFESSPHAETFQLMELSGCITCHGNHAILETGEFLLVGDTSACASCHESDAGTEVADSMASEIRGLRDRIAVATDLLQQAHQSGMEVSGPLYDLNEAHQRVIVARNEVHVVDTERIRATTGEGMAIADASHQAGIQAFEDLAFRRRGLTVALAFIGLVIVALILWIREVDRDLKVSSKSS